MQPGHTHSAMPNNRTMGRQTREDYGREFRNLQTSLTALLSSTVLVA